MTDTDPRETHSILMLIAGAKGAIGTTLAAAVAALPGNPQSVVPYLTTAETFPWMGWMGKPEAIKMAGWDITQAPVSEAIRRHGVLPAAAWEPAVREIDAIPVREAPDPMLPFEQRVAILTRDMEAFRRRTPHAAPVLANLLPACAGPSARGPSPGPDHPVDEGRRFPDLAYVTAAIRSGVPVVNFTPNPVELPEVLEAAVRQGVPLAGRDGKTGQTYLKVVLASALKARRLAVDGWYSLNILGNADGENLMDPECARGKLSNKTELLDQILGYRVGERYGAPAHKVHIDYYPPRGDAKEAWDVIDFTGIFDMPMSLRLNLQGRDSILAAPMIIDLCRWMTALKSAGRSGPVPELGLYFKKPVGDNPPISFQDQVLALERLASACERAWRSHVK